MQAKKYKSVDEYFREIPQQALGRMEQIRQLLRSVAPMAEEMITYNMPTLRYRGTLFHYAAYRGHIGFYALPQAHALFREELAPYVQGKGSVRFPHDRPLPLALIGRMAAHRYKEQLEGRK